MSFPITPRYWLIDFLLLFSVKRPRKSLFPNQGFTLIEILTAAVLSAGLLAVFITIAVKFAILFEKLGGGEVRVESISSRALDMLEEDLGAAFIKQDQFEWVSYWDKPEFASQALGNMVNGEFVGEARAEDFQPDKSGVLIFYSQTRNRESDDSSSGDILAIAYRLAYQDPIAPEDNESRFKTFSLYRIANPPKETFEFMLNRRNQASLWINDKSEGGRNPNISPPYDINCLLSDFLVVRNVVDFRVKFFCSCLSSQNGEERFFSVPTVDNPIFRVGGDSATNEPSKYVGQLPAFVPPEIRFYPTTAEISLTILSEEGLKLMRAALDGRRDDIRNLKQLVEQHGRTFTRTVVMKTQI